MGWACTRCGDLNSGSMDACQECGAEQGTASPVRIEPQPISLNLIWLATLLGGALGGYLLAIWNARQVKHGNRLLLLVYGLVGILGSAVCVIIIAAMTPPAGGEPGFGIPVALALSFLLVSIPYNRDRLAVSQWLWSHPIRKLVIEIGRGGSKLSYLPFATAEGELFGAREREQTLVSIPVFPIIVIIVSAIIGTITLVLGNGLAR